ncbi:ribonuclease H-like domain-containing protein [Tanacetum coccineum]
MLLLPSFYRINFQPLHHHLLTRVLVKLDLDNRDYASWEYFFDKLCQGYEVTKYIHGSSDATSTSTPTPLTPKEIKEDTIVLSWIFTTISDTLQESLGSPVTSEDVVTFALEGLPDKFDQVCGIMHHHDTFPDLKTTRSMLTTEEIRLKSKSLSLPVDSWSSSPLVLMVESGTNRLPSNPQVKSLRPCYNFAKRSCRFGNDCKSVHDTNAKPANTNVSQISSNNTDEFLVKLLDRLGLTNTTNTSTSVGLINMPTIIPTVPVANPNAQTVAPLAQPATQPEFTGSTITSGQETTLPHAFTAGKLHDPTTGAWNMDTDGTLSRYKAHLVVNGSTQLEGVDVDEIFSPVVKSGTIRTVLSVAVSRHWPIHQLDVKNAFLHGDLALSMGSSRPLELGFSDLHLGMDTAYLLLYVDDILLTASFETLLQQIIRSLHQEFSLTDIDSLNYFMGIYVMRDSAGMFLSQRKYATEILDRAHMVSCNSSRTLVDTESKHGDDGDPPMLSRSSEEAEYRGVANVIAETCWLGNLLHLVVAGQVRIFHVPSRYQYADIFTKGLPSELFEEFRTSLSVQCPLASIARECYPFMKKVKGDCFECKEQDEDS